MAYKDPSSEHARDVKKRLRKRNIAKGQCTRCRSLALPGKKLCQYHTDYANHYNSKQPIAKRRAWSRTTRERLRAAVYAHYGNSCACCGEATSAFLTIDHIHGDGAAHRKRDRNNASGTGLMRWLKRNGFPAGFRILCGNCNMALGTYGMCPHGKLAPQVTGHPANAFNIKPEPLLTIKPLKRRSSRVGRRSRGQV